MDKYFVRISPGLSGMHSVHKESCPFVPDNGNRIPLGRFRDCKEALREAREYFQRVDGCYFCNKECYESKESNEDYCWLQINYN
jgi:hypothetical protein